MTEKSKKRIKEIKMKLRIIPCHNEEALLRQYYIFYKEDVKFLLNLISRMREV